jgi:hypothetical protein
LRECAREVRESREDDLWTDGHELSAPTRGACASTIIRLRCASSSAA